MADVPPTLYLLVSLVGAAVVLTWRFKETSAPVTARSLLLPPLAMSTGLFMFFAPQTHVPLSWAAGALTVGAFGLWWPLSRSSKLTRQGEQFMLQRSPAFAWILVGLFAVRFALRSWLERYVSQVQTGALFYLLALGAIVRWRVSLLLELRRLRGAAILFATER